MMHMIIPFLPGTQVECIEDDKKHIDKVYEYIIKDKIYVRLWLHDDRISKEIELEDFKKKWRKYNENRSDGE